jgi:glycosyltransferase involved in cell wall biosynthesis
MKLQILIPQYNEDERILKPLLDSIEVQQNIDLKNDIGVIIVNDGSDTILDSKFFDRYSFSIEYHLHEHKGVSATRNACLDYATADYVMFCDADDMFYNACGLYIVFREIDNGGFDSLVSAFLEESRHPETKEPLYITHDMDSTFVHGKIHRRKFLINNNIRWNDKLTIHEDSYFNCLCQKLAGELKYSPTPFYLWKWRDASVCRHDPKYILKTYNNMLDSIDALTEQLLDRNRKEDAQFHVVGIIYDAYFTMNKDEWLNQENKEYRYAVEKRFKEFWLKYKYLHDSIPQEAKTQIIMGIKNRMYAEGMVLETLTFSEWIKQVEDIK